jgi:hypothetical protein
LGNGATVVSVTLPINARAFLKTLGFRRCHGSSLMSEFLITSTRPVTCSTCRFEAIAQ